MFPVYLLTALNSQQKWALRLSLIQLYQKVNVGCSWKKSEDGFSVEKNIGEWYIYYNDKKDYGRINNTIMHEIGHIILDHSEDSELAEKEVKFFAKYALVPPVLVHKLKLDNSMDIADIFEVSFEAACYAYSYYKKWLQYGSSEYTKYELTLLNLFQNISW